MIGLDIIILILVVHFLADFGLQTHDQATKKSHDQTQLLYHVSVYSGVWFLISYFLFLDLVKVFAFTLITFAFHYWTDYFSSRIGKPYWEKNDYHNAFVIVGADQVLHLVQLFALYTILM